MLHRFGLLFLLFILATGVFAQVSAPPRDQTQAAVLADMSRRTGETITINSLASQQWYYGTYDFVRGLGCPLAPQTPPTSGNWQRFIFNYRGLDYIYMVSDNLQSLILCNEPTLPTAIPASPTATVTQAGTGQSGGGVAQTQATSTPQGSGQSGGGFGDAGNVPTANAASCLLPPRLTIGLQGRVTPGDANWLHSEAMRSSEKIGEIPATYTFVILAGPVCDSATGMNYWQITYNGFIGWTSEGLNGEYWLEPLITGFSPQNIQSAIVPDWANSLPTDEDVLIATSSNSSYMAIAWGNQLELHITEDGSKITELSFDSPISSLEFATGDTLLIVGTEAGEVQVLRFNEPIEVLFQGSHEGAITATLLSFDNIILVVADNQRILSFWSLLTPDAPIRRIELPEVAGDLEFTTNPFLLLVHDLEGHFLTALQAPRP